MIDRQEEKDTMTPETAYVEARLAYEHAQAKADAAFRPRRGLGGPMRTLFRLLSAMSTVRAARRGPGALARREGRRRGHRLVRRVFR